jgi:hypothetical protein
MEAVVRRLHHNSVKVVFNLNLNMVVNETSTLWERTLVWLVIRSEPRDRQGRSLRSEADMEATSWTFYSFEVTTWHFKVIWVEIFVWKISTTESNVIA